MSSKLEKWGNLFGNVTGIFNLKDAPYTLRSGRNILASQPNTTGYGIENAAFSWSEDMAYNDIFRKRVPYVK